MSHENKAMGEWMAADWEHAMSGAGSTGNGDSAIGRTLYDLQRRLIGTLRQAQDGRVYILAPDGRSVVQIPFQGGQFLTAFGDKVSGGLILGPEGDIIDTVSESFLRPPGGGGGSRALSVAEQQQLLEQQQEFQAGQTAAGQTFTTGEREASQVFQAEQARLAEENRQRESLRGQAASLLEQFLSIQQQARQIMGQIQGEDPFRASASAMGQVTRGTTPQMAFEQDLRQSINAQPTFDPNAPLPQLTGQVEALREQVGAGLPEIPPFVGAFSHGGTIDMKAGRDGVFRAKGRSSGGFRDVEGRGPVSFLVGEALDGQPNPEIVTVDGDNITVARFAGGFSHGGSPSSFLQQAAPLFEHTGFENIPTTSFGEGGFPGLFRRNIPAGLDLQGIAQFASERPADFGATTLERLGVRPRLFRVQGMIGTPGFMVMPDGRVLHIKSGADLARFGLNPNEFVTISRESARQMGLPERLEDAAGTLTATDLPDIEPGIGSRTRFGALPVPLMLPVGNQRVPIPDPRLIANLFRRLDVAGKQNLLSLYRHTENITADQALERIRFFTPAGRAQAGTTASLG